MHNRLYNIWNSRENDVFSSMELNLVSWEVMDNFAQTFQYVPGVANRGAGINQKTLEEHYISIFNYCITWWEDEATISITSHN